MENSDQFTTDLKEVFVFLKRRDDKDALRTYVEQNEAFRHLKEDAYDVIAVYSGSQELVVGKESYQKKEGIDMCKALQEMWDEAKAEGEKAGREAVRAEAIAGIEMTKEAINHLNYHLMEDGRTDDLLRSTQDAVFQKQLMEEYGIGFLS